MTKRVAITIPPTPPVQYVTLKVKAFLQIGDVFYAEGDVIQVTFREAVSLLDLYPDHFEEVITS